MEILSELVPTPRHIGGVIDSLFASTIGWEAVQRGALRLGLDLHVVEVRAPGQLESAINLKTAKALGLTVPPALVARADEVIE